MRKNRDRSVTCCFAKEYWVKIDPSKYAMLLLCLLAVFLIPACGSNEKKVRPEFSTPEAAYEYWLNAGVDGDLNRSTECLSEASKRMMEQMAKNRDEFMKRMVAGAKIFKTFSIADKRISDDKALILIESPDKKQKVPIPLVREKGEWKVDLVKMFGG